MYTKVLSYLSYNDQKLGLLYILCPTLYIRLFISNMNIGFTVKRMTLPVGSLHVDSAFCPRCPHYRHGHTVVSLDGVVEVAVTAVHTFVKQQLHLVPFVILGSSDDQGGQAGEQYLQEDTHTETRSEQMMRV